MYTEDEITRVALECTCHDEVMAASHFFRMLINIGWQPPSVFLSFALIKRFKELA